VVSFFLMVRETLTYYYKTRFYTKTLDHSRKPMILVYPQSDIYPPSLCAILEPTSDLILDLNF